MTLVSKTQYLCDGCYLMYGSYIAAEACCGEGWTLLAEAAVPHTEDGPDLFTDMEARFTTREDIQ